VNNPTLSVEVRMRKWLVAAAALGAAAVVATRPFAARATAAAQPTQSWCDANARRPLFGAILCAALADGDRVYIRGLPFEIVTVGADYVTLRPELSGERRRLLAIPFTAIRRLERPGRPRELILDE
jgi:hypothetical protein